MAFPAYMSISGAKQGQFKGESTRAKRKDWIPVLAFAMGVESPRDAATGQASGKRQYKPVRITKEWGAASPQAMTACVTNEVLSTVAIEFTKIGADGEEFVYQTVTLTDAAISRVSRVKGKPALTDDVLTSNLRPEHLGSLDPHEIEEMDFTFRKIEFTDHDGSTSFADNWEAQN